MLFLVVEIDKGAVGCAWCVGETWVLALQVYSIARCTIAIKGDAILGVLTPGPA